MINMEEKRETLTHTGFKTIEKNSKKSNIKSFLSGTFSFDIFKPKTKKQRFIMLCIQTGVCAAILIAVISLKAINKPYAENTLSTLNNVINVKVDIDEDLGRLKFVSDDMVSVFNDDLSLPVEALSYQLIDDDKSMMILGKKNEPVFATFGGEIVEQENMDNSDLIIIEHESGVQSIYSGVIPTVFENDSVTAGQAVGYLLGDYLTVNIFYNGDFLNPDDFIKDPVLR